MQEIESRAIQNYQENMLFLSKNNPALHSRLLALDTILSDGTYPQKYDLEYKDGYFDVVELSSGNFLYNQNSNKFSEEICNKINYKKNEHTFKSYRKVNFEDESLKFLKKQSAYTNFISIAELSDYYHKYNSDEMSLTQIEKFIFLGNGLGLHTQKIVEKFDVQISLIIEKDVELFRLSLFTTNYSEVFSKKTAFFSVGETLPEFHKTFNAFFVKGFFKNQYIKFNMFSSIYEDIVHEIRHMLITRPEATYSNERLLVKNKRVISKISENYKFIDLQKKLNDKSFSDKPWLVLGAGPSINTNAEWLVENQDKFIIIAVFTALKTLQRIGVKPDIAVQIDENDFTTDQMLENLGDLSFLDDSVIFFSASVSKLLFDKFDKEKIYLHEDRTEYKLKKSTLPVASVGETVFSIALIFNPSEIYLLGLDLALSDDGKTHSEDHFKVSSVEKEESDERFELDQLNVVKGNLKDQVSTTSVLLMSIIVTNIKVKQYKSENQNIYNLSQNGAFLENTIPTKIEQLDIKNKIDKDNFRDQLFKIFDSYSTQTLSDEELNSIENRQSQIGDYFKMLEIFKNTPHSSHDVFLNSYVNLTNSILNHECKMELLEIFTIFFLKIGSHIDDFIHTKEIKNKKKHYKKLKQILVNQIEKILTAYEEDLKLLK
jgi:hypothetical protein